MIHRVGGNDQASGSGRLERLITPANNPKRWIAWARSRIGRTRACKPPRSPIKTSDGKPRLVPSGYTLGDAYLKQVEPILFEQLARASVRLADELNAAFEPARAPQKSLSTPR